MIRLIQCSN